jgi:hypothetical protein
MLTKVQLDLGIGEKPVDRKVYHSMIGSLLYLCASRPDIMLSVELCARFQSAPKECHFVVVKRILRYLIHTPTLGLWYPKGSTFELVGHSDSDWADDKVDQKSTSGACQFIGRSLVSCVQEIELHVPIHHQILIHFHGILLYSIVVDEANLERLWCVSCYGASSM